MVNFAIQSQGLPKTDRFGNESIYVVFTPPGISSTPPGAFSVDPGYKGYHDVNINCQSPFSFNVMREAWINTDSIDSVTNTLSHEIVETLTDPNPGDCWTVVNTSPQSELADNEAQNYSYRLNGFKMQSFWSKADNGYLVDDGFAQKFHVKNGALNLYGDQYGVGGNDTITIDIGDSGGVFAQMGNEYVEFDPGQITSVNVYPGGGNNTVNVSNTNVPISIHSGATDTVNIGNSSTGVQGIKGNVTISNGQQSTTLNIDDTANTSGRTATITGGYVAGLAPATIYYTQGALTELNVLGSSGSNTFTVTSTPTNNDVVATHLTPGSGYSTVNIEGISNPLTVDGGSGTQTVIVGSHGNKFGGTLANIRGSIYLENTNAAGETFLFVDDTADNTTRSWDLNWGAISTTAMPGGIYWGASGPGMGGLVSLQVRGGNGANTINVNSTGMNGYSYTTEVQTGTAGDNVNVRSTVGNLNITNTGGHDTVMIGSSSPSIGGNLAAIGGNIFISGPGNASLIVDDSGNTLYSSAVLFANELTAIAPAPIIWDTKSGSSGVSSIVIHGSAAVTNYNIVAVTPGVPTTINAGNGNDTFTIGSGAIANSLTINGGAGSNTLKGPDVASTWNITGANTGKINGAVSFAKFANLTGGSAIDTFTFATAGSVAGKINGGATGTGDWLDYSACASAVAVNLSTGAATRTAGILNIQNVRGSNVGNTLSGSALGNLLIGGTGIDSLTAGAGRSILIGGGGADKVKGAGADDILIGGTTTFSSNTALAAILAEWRSTSSFATRVTHLKSGGGLNGINKLIFGTTVIADGAINNLTGGGGTNWFFKGAMDKIADLHSTDRIN